MAKIKLLYEDIDHEYEMSKEDILIYAQQIGIDINTEKYLMWIAEKGLSARVPKPWLILSDEKDRIFYYNEETHEKSWNHPLDREFAALVSEERSKSLNSVSSDYGFDSKLSSLADAPPLSSSDKNTPPSNKLGRSEGGLQSKKIDFGHIENRRGGQLAPVRLNALKMPAPPTVQKPSSGMSFMPKGATLSKNVKHVKEKINYDDSYYDEEREVHPADDSNESVNSDEGSKYSYEESDEDEKNIHGMDAYDMFDASQLSPVHSADESPDALDINSLVQLGTKLPPRLDNSRKEQTESLNKENSLSLNLRKVNQPSFLKPLTQPNKKKNSFKGTKASRKESAGKSKFVNENENDFEEKLSIITEEQRLMLEQIQKEWQAMQDKLEKEEKEKYEEMMKDSSRKLEEEELKLRNESSEKLSKIKEDLQKKIEEEGSAAEKSLQTLKASNQEKINEEEKKLKKELEKLCDSMKMEMKRIEEENSVELAHKRKEFEDSAKEELIKLQLIHDSEKQKTDEAHLAEISTLQEVHKQKLEELKKMHEKEEIEMKTELNSSSSSTVHELEDKIRNLEELIKAETEEYKKLLNEKDQILKEITTEQLNLEAIKSENAKIQTHMEGLQDEVEKMETDLDMLREEKSALVSEISILKENINNEKSNLLNLENKIKSSKNKENFNDLVEKEVNTYITFICTESKASQISVTNNNASCQTEDIIVSISEVSCQVSTQQMTANKSCQVDNVPYTDNKATVKAVDCDRVHANAADKGLETALIGLNTKLDSRINMIEQQLKLLQEHLTKPSSSQHVFSSQEPIQSQFTEIKSSANEDSRNIHHIHSPESSLPFSVVSNQVPVSSQSQVQMKCKCDLGDPSSCGVIQDVKNSIYHLNDILNHSFAPPLTARTIYKLNQPITNYSSPFEDFYTQFREMQEKRRLTELKHICENEAVKQTKNSTAETTAGILYDKGSSKPSYSVHSSLYSFSVSEDPLIRARNIILREQAKAWKEQQQQQQHQLLNSSTSHKIFSSNNFRSSSEDLQSSVTGLTSTLNMPSFQQSFYNFEVDPETDYNIWMSRLGALQQRLRSHKIL